MLGQLPTLRSIGDRCSNGSLDALAFLGFGKEVFVDILDRHIEALGCLVALGDPLVEQGVVP